MWHDSDVTVLLYLVSWSQNIFKKNNLTLFLHFLKVKEMAFYSELHFYLSRIKKKHNVEAILTAEKSSENTPTFYYPVS